MTLNSKKDDSSIEIWKDPNLFCHDLPSKPNPDVGWILVTGASGYIGGRLVPELMARGYNVRIMVRAESPEYNERWPGVEIVVADALKPESLKSALKGIHTIYYLIHSLLLGPKKFAIADIQAAKNIRKTAEEMQVKRIIYLGGLGDVRSQLSNHLRNRAEVADELIKGKTPVTIFRAAIIIGSGSASYEIISNLTKRLPILFIPHWAENRCQPIGIRDVIKYLVGSLEKPETTGNNYDIGGRDILSYKKMMMVIAELLGKKRFFMPFFELNLSIYAYAASLITPVPASITRSLIEGLKNEVICQNHEIYNILPFKPLSYREAIILAMTREEQDKIYTRWSDSYPPAHRLAIKLHELDNIPNFTAKYTLKSEKSAASLFKSICRIGGKEGWFYNNYLWRLRGKIDSILLGVGLSRGRRSISDLKINDVIDFWRVEDIQNDKRLLLRSEMKMPGKAWLEFTIDNEESRRILSVTAYYDTHAFSGYFYWYIFLPFHNFIFNNLIKQIDMRSE